MNKQEQLETLARAKKVLLEARALRETMQNRQAIIEKNILTKYVFEMERNGKRITEPKYAYRMSEKKFEIFLDLVHEAYIDLGIEDHEYNIDYVYRYAELERKAEDVFLELGIVYTAPDVAKITGDDENEIVETLLRGANNLNRRRELLELMLNQF